MRVKNKRQAIRHRVASKIPIVDTVPNSDDLLSMEKLLEHVASNLGQHPARHAIMERWSSGEIRVWRRWAKVNPYRAELSANQLGELELVPSSFVTDLEARGVGFRFQSGGIHMGDDRWVYLFASRTDAAHFWPWPGDQPAVQPGRRSSRGAKPTWDWEAALIEAAVFILEHDLPKTQDELVGHISTWFGDHAPGDTQIKVHIAPLFRRAKAVLGR
jgi:hypothetical protein